MSRRRPKVPLKRLFPDFEARKAILDRQAAQTRLASACAAARVAIAHAEISITASSTPESLATARATLAVAEGELDRLSAALATLSDEIRQQRQAAHRAIRDAERPSAQSPVAPPPDNRPRATVPPPTSPAADHPSTLPFFISGPRRRRDA